MNEEQDRLGLRLPLVAGLKYHVLVHERSTGLHNAEQCPEDEDCVEIDGWWFRKDTASEPYPSGEPDFVRLEGPIT